MSRLSRLSTTFALVVAAAALTAGPALARTHDHDRMPDRWEKRNHLNVKKDDSRRDRDRDGLSNYGEYRAHTNPRKKDSDHDGRRDSREDYRPRQAAQRRRDQTGFDPGDKDSDNDGVKDGRENAGKIVKLSGSSITIKLAVGGSLTARLGDDLAVDCGASAQAQSTGQATDGEDARSPARTPTRSMPGEDDEPADDGEPPIAATTSRRRPRCLRGPGGRRGRRAVRRRRLRPGVRRRHRWRGRRVRCRDAEGRRHGPQGQGHPHRLGPGARVPQAGREPQAVATAPLSRSRPCARSACGRARRSSAGTFTTGLPSRSASRSFGSVIIFM